MRFFEFLFSRRNILWPTWGCWTALITLVFLPVLLWWSKGEAFLSKERRLTAEVLIVECWIGREGVTAAANEFKRESYSYIVATGSTIKRGWLFDGQCVADLAKQQLLQLGIPDDKIIVARDRDTDRDRTFESAVSAFRELKARGINPSASNVFTLGSHARRSRLVFSKAFKNTSDIGVISWMPDGNQQANWWESSERTKAMITETFGLAYEVLLNGGRAS